MQKDLRRGLRRFARSLSAADAKRLADGATRRELARGDVYVGLGEPLPGFCCVVRGSLTLALGAAKKRVFRVVAAGDTLLEAPALVNAPSPFTARAGEASIVLAIPVKHIRAIATRNGAFAWHLVSLLAERAMLGIRDLGSLDLLIEQRLAAHLASVARKNRRGTWDAPLSHGKGGLAARFGVTKETMSRAFRKLADEGLLQQSPRTVTIIDLKRLAERGEPRA